MTKSIICFLTVNPSKLCYDFIKKLGNHNDIYICIDDNEYNIPDYNNEIKIIKYRNKDVENEGFKNTHLWIPGAIARDKALYYFFKNKIEYDFIWFIEEDVFIPNANIIKNIDNKYKDEDLLVRSNRLFYGNKKHWHWKTVTRQIKDKIPYPWGASMICAIRCSKKLMENIFSFVKIYKTLFLDEVLFNSIAIFNNLSIKTIPELSTILWRKKGGWKLNEIKESNLYHPIKNIKEQYMIREYLESDSKNIINKKKSIPYILNESNQADKDFKNKKKRIIISLVLILCVIVITMKKKY